MERVVEARGPFSFELAMRYLATSPSTIAEKVGEGEYARAFRSAVDGGIWIARVSAGAGSGVRVVAEQFAGGLGGSAPAPPRRSRPPAHPRPEGTRPPGLRAPEWHPHARAAPLDPQDAAAAVDQAGDIARLAFGLLGDPTGLDEVAGRDAVVGPLLRRYRGLRPLVIPDPFEALVWAILGQQINVGFAAKTKRALIEAYGESVGGGLWLFPSSERLAGVSPEELRPLQISRQKATYIAELARADVDFELLRSLPDEEVVEQLTRLKGIGRWTAEYLLLRGFGRPDAIPAGDMGLRIVLGRLHGLGRNATELEVRQMAEGWAPWRGHVAFALWFALQQRDA